MLGQWETYFTLQGTHAQNYHIFTPGGRARIGAWSGGRRNGSRNLPYANAAYSYNFNPGQSGHLVLEFWITPF